MEEHKLERKIIKRTAEEIPGSVALTGLYFRLLPIQILMVAIVYVNGIVTSLFASNYVGAEAMSAIGLYSPFNQFFTAVSTVFVGGSQILCAKYMARNELDKSQRIFSWNLICMAVASIGSIAILLLIALTGLSQLITSDADVLKHLNLYMIGRAIGLPAFFFANQLAAFLSLENQTKRTVAASVACVCVTAGASWLFVDALSMEAFGLALASSAGSWAYFLVQVVYFLKGSSALKIKFFPIEGSDWRDIISYGFSGGIGTMLKTFRDAILNAITLAFVGPIGISAYTAVGSLLDLFWSIPDGMTSVTRMLESVALGEEDRQSAVDLMRINIRRCVPIMCGICALLILFADPFTRMFYQDPSSEVYQLTKIGFMILPLAMPFFTFATNFAAYGYTFQKNGLTRAISISEGLVSVAAFAAMLVPLFGMYGRYEAHVLTKVMSCVIIVAYACIKLKKFPTSLEELMVLPDDFGVGEDERLDISILSTDEVPAISEEVEEFCLAHGIDGRRAKLSGDFLEGMAKNIAVHGLDKDNKPHTIDIRVVHKPVEDADNGGDIILRIKDDFEEFDPVERMQMTDPEVQDSLTASGIRTLFEEASDVQYQNMLGLNVFTIRI